MIELNNFPKKEIPQKNLLKPLFYLITLNSVFPYLIWKIKAKSIDEIEFVDTFRFGLNTLAIPFFYGLQTWVLSLFFGWNVAGIYFLVSLFLILIYSKLAITNTEIS